VPMGGNKVSLNPELAEKRPEAYISMGHTAERVAKKYGVTREQQDAFALRSHEKAVEAQRAGKFKDELVAVAARVYEGGKLGIFPFTADECPRADTSIEALAKLKPVFTKDGSVTAGNSSPMNDGAAATVLLSDKRAAALGVKALGRLR